MARRIASWMAAGCVLAVLSAGAAPASDFSHLCETADGAFVMENGVLFEASAYRAGSAVALPHTVLSETVEAEETGYCISWAKAAAGRMFDFQYRRSVQRIAFTFGGARRDVEIRCTLEADGLPANLDCDRRVVANRQGVVAEMPAATSYWEHNGSTVALVAEGSQRRFMYTAPRAGLVANGVRPGTLLFDGQSDGRRYEGRARLFTKHCGELSYAVNGPIERDGTRVVLFGKAPRVNAECRPTGRIDDRLVFDLTELAASDVLDPPAAEGRAPEATAPAAPEAPLASPMRELAALFGGVCEAVDLAAWNHPSLAAIRARKQARLQWAMLCRNRTLPVFGIDFDYDPQGRSRDFFMPLYDDVLGASGGTGFAFVSIKDKLVIDVTRAGKAGMSVDFRQAPELPAPRQNGAAEQDEVRLFLARASFSTPMEWTVRADPDRSAIGFIRPDGKAEITVLLWPAKRPLPSGSVVQPEHVVVADAPAVRYRQKIDGGMAEHLLFEDAYADGSRVAVSYRALGEPIEEGAAILDLFLADLKLDDSPPGGWTPAGPPPDRQADPFAGLDLSAFETSR